MTTAEAAAALGVTTGRIRQLILDGQLDAKKVGRDWNVSKRSVDRRALQPVR